MNDLLEQIKKNLIDGRVDQNDEGFDGTMAGRPGVIELVERALERNVPAAEILSQSLTPGMVEVGRLYDNGEYLTPDMLASAECIKQVMPIINPSLVKGEAPNKGTFLICTVHGDLHDIGKDIVGTMLMGAGYEVIDMGTDVTADAVVENLRKTKASYLGLSALLTSTMAYMGDIIAKITEEKLRRDVKILIGGAPVNTTFAREIGADSYCDDAFDAINQLNELSK